ncbi:MAG: DNA-formamidopyrimidine glycosylase [Mollicutes bacterium PWAP]|nr:DNA-formamidopyrimidine glycosylase [Mollicutes bacterium PWAP]
MPELPEVWIVRDKLNKEILNLKIENVFVRKNNILKNITSDIFIKKIKNKKIINIDNKGKYIIFSLDKKDFMVSHLMMDGSWRWAKKEFSDYDFIFFKMSNGKTLVFRDPISWAHILYYESKEEMDSYINKKVGKYPWNWKSEDIIKKVKRRKSPIKATLIDQSLISGLGNIYSVEVLFRAKISPFKATNQVSKEEWENILKLSELVMKEIYNEGAFFTEKFNSFEKHEMTYGPKMQLASFDKNCYICETKIKKGWIKKRGTYYCPNCQN